MELLTKTNFHIKKSMILYCVHVSKTWLIKFFSHLVNKLTVFTFIRFICVHVSLFNFATWDSAKKCFLRHYKFISTFSFLFNSNFLNFCIFYSVLFLRVVEGEKFIFAELLENIKS